jgi:hypothetical protein
VFLFLAYVVMRRLLRLVAGSSAAAVLEVENAVLGTSWPCSVER